MASDTSPSPQRYERLFSMSLEMMCIAGFDGYLQEVNPVWERVLGFTPQELTSSSFLDFVHPDDREAARSEVRRLLSGTDTIAFVDRFRCRDGSYKILLWNAAPDLKEMVIYAVARDITESRAAAERLDQQRAWIDGILDASRDGILVEQDGVIVFANKACGQLLGYDDAGVLVGLSVASVLADPAGKPVHRSHGSDLMSPDVYEVSARRKNGTRVRLEASASRFAAGGTSRVVTVVRNVADRETIDEGLRASEERNRLILAFADGIAQQRSIETLIAHAGTRLQEIVPGFCAIRAMRYIAELDTFEQIGIHTSGMPPEYASPEFALRTSRHYHGVKETRAPLVALTPSATGVHLDDYPILTALGVRSGLVLPLIVGDRFLGGLGIASLNEGVFAGALVETLTAIAHFLAVALDNILAYEVVTASREDQHAQLVISNALATIRDREQMFQTVATELNKVVPFDTFRIRVRRSDGTVESYTRLRKGDDGTFLPRDDAEEDTLADLDRFHTEVLEPLRGPFSIAGEDLDRMAEQYTPVKLSKKAGEHALLFVPVRPAGGAPAFITLTRYTMHQFSGDEARILSLLAPQVALAWQNLVSFEEIERLKLRFERETIVLREEVRDVSGFAGIVGQDPAVADLLAKIAMVAPTDSTVLILGETGTGKELIARAIHERSTRADNIMVKVNCASIPTGLIESEFFGHEKGAFTGAIQRKTGRFELAHSGTIFLDEIGDLPMDAQAKLLRVLQDGEFERVGGTQTIRTDVRVIAATNASLSALVEERRFRADLFYRLQVFPVTIPPLRERPGDIRLLALFFAEKYSRKLHRRVTRIAGSSLAALRAYPFPGNIRELEHMVERAVITATGDVLTIDLPASGPYASGQAADNDTATLEAVERNHILAACERLGWRIRGKGGVAEILDINPSTLESRMKKLGIARPRA